jgi:hypothetical protein
MSELGWRRWTRIFRRDPGEEVDEELRFHVEQRVRDYVDRGMDAEAARRAAHQRMGDLERVRNECTGLLTAERRTEEARTRLSVSWLDVKPGVRMLAKYPGLSLVAVTGMAMAVAIGAGYFAAIGMVSGSDGCRWRKATASSPSATVTLAHLSAAAHIANPCTTSSCGATT